MLFYAAFLFSVFLPSPDELSLSGAVFDLNAGGISDVQVALEHTTERQQWTATTRADGTFRFDHLSLGTYRVKVQKEGYFESSTEVRLETSKTVEFTLAPMQTLHQEIEVISRPEPINPDSVSSQNTVNEQFIQNVAYTGKRDFLNALALMPGILRDSSGQLHVHGSRADQVRYELDGVNLTDTSGTGLSSRIPIDSIESVDIDLAGYSAEFGKGSGGIVRVHSQFVGNQYRFNLTDFIPGINFQERTISDFSPRLLLSGPVVQGKLWFMYSGTLRFVRTFIDDLPKGENLQNETVTDQLFKLQWNLKESHVLTLGLLHNSEYLSNAGLSMLRPRETTTNILRRGKTLFLSDRHVTGRTLLETIFQWTDSHNSDVAKGVVPLEARPDRWRGNFFTDRIGSGQRLHAAQTVAWERSAGRFKHRLKAGGEFDHVISNLWMDRRPFLLFNDSGDLRTSITFSGSNSADIRNREYGVFMLDRIVFSPKLQVELGMRLDRERVAGRNNFGPRTAFSFFPLGTNHLKLSGGAGLFYDNIPLMSLQLPRMQLRYTTVFDEGGRLTAARPTAVRVSPELRNPSGFHWNLELEHEWAPRWVSRINYVRKKGRDQVRLAAIARPDGFDMIFDNSGRSTYSALEFALDRPIRTNLRILSSYTYSDAKGRPALSLDFPDPALETAGKAPLEWNTRHRFVSWGYFPIPGKMDASFSIEARSGFPYTTIDDLNRAIGGYNSHTMPAYFVTNVNVEKEIPIPFGKRMAFRVGVTNLFNRFNPRYVDANVNSPLFMTFSESSGRHLVARVRILKK
jgi:outer membrane receptor for ferrienterochelin and colicin